jgi:hypothetical protein
MLFLLNDVVLNLEAGQLAPPLNGGQFSALNMTTITALGAELYATEPLLHQTNLDRARRLAGLITLKAPQINAALFIAPAKHCPPGQVSCRFAQLDLSVISNLNTRQKDGALSTVHVDSAVWKRLAA